MNSYQYFDVEPLTPGIGAIIHGINLAGDLKQNVLAEIKQAWYQHLVLFFRDQKMSHEQHLHFGQQFGKLHIHPAAPFAGDNPALMKVHTDENSRRNNGEGWHSDVSADEKPPMASILHIHQVPGFYGDHPAQRENPRSEHPVIRTHPETGKKSLYVNSGFTRRIKGITKPESDALLAMLFEHVKNPNFHCRFQWQANSVALWDNRCTQHMAVWDYYPETRSGIRVTIGGERPY